MREAPQREQTYRKVQTNRTKIWSWKGEKEPFKKAIPTKYANRSFGEGFCGGVKNRARHRINEDWSGKRPTSVIG